MSEDYLRAKKIFDSFKLTDREKRFYEVLEIGGQEIWYLEMYSIQEHKKKGLLYCLICPFWDNSKKAAYSNDFKRGTCLVWKAGWTAYNAECLNPISLSLKLLEIIEKENIDLKKYRKDLK